MNLFYKIRQSPSLVDRHATTERRISLFDTMSSAPHPTDSSTSGKPQLPLAKTALLLLTLLLIFISINLVLYRLISILSRSKPSTRRPNPSASFPTHLLVVLGSGGHTAEMLNMLSGVSDLAVKYTFRTYVVSSGDGFSARKAAEFEKGLQPGVKSDGKAGGAEGYEIVTVRRARKVHQSIFTTPWSAAWSLWDCIKVLRGRHPDQTAGRAYPDLILSNGPGTGVCVITAAITLLFFGYSGRELPRTSPPGEEVTFEGAGRMRTVFIESWARTRTYSLSGTLVSPLVDRFLVQWPRLVDPAGRSEYVGTLVA